MTDKDKDLVVWRGSFSTWTVKGGWPKRAPVDSCPRTLSAWSHWFDLRGENHPGAPFAALVAIDEYIKAGEPVPPRLAGWFNNCFWGFCKNPHETTLDKSFGIRREAGEVSSYSAYYKNTRHLLITVDFFVVEFETTIALAARCAMAYRGEEHYTIGTIRDLYKNFKRREQSIGSYNQYLNAIEILHGLEKTAGMDAVQLKKDRCALARKVEQYRIRRLDGVAHDEIMRQAAEYFGYRAGDEKRGIILPSH